MVSEDKRSSPWSVALDAPPEGEIELSFSSLRTPRLAGSDNPVPEFFKSAEEEE